MGLGINKSNGFCEASVQICRLRQLQAPDAERITDRANNRSGGMSAIASAIERRAGIKRRWVG